MLLLTLAVAALCPTANAVSAAEKFALKDGDRVAFIGATLIERDRHYGEFEAMLRSRFPGLKLSFRNMAWPGDTTTVQLRPLNFGSLEKHLDVLKPTVIFVSYGGNEAYEGDAGLAKFIDGYKTILDLFAKTQARIVMISPTRHENLGPPFPDPAKINAHLEKYTAAMRQLAHDRDIHFVDFFDTLIGVDAPPKIPLTENGIHLSDYGYWRAAQVLTEELGCPEAQLDFGQGANRPGTQFELVPAQVLIPPPEGTPPSALQTIKPLKIQVAGLPVGNYDLRINGEAAAHGTAKEWEAGIVINGGKAFERGAQLRKEIVRKNLLFFNRWRAHNGEYIYGRRSSTSEGYDKTKDGGNSGNPSFPGEMAEFERLMQVSEAKADDLAKPQKYACEIVPRKSN